MSAFQKFDLSLIPSTGEKVDAAQVAQVAQEDRSCATFATCAAGEHADAQDWQAYFDERAGIAEHHGGLSRGDAERQAFECCVMEWLWRNPPPASGPERCAHCGQPLGDFGRDGLPYLTGDGGHTWLHSGCHGDWTAQRRAEAVAALAILALPAIPARSELPAPIRRPTSAPAGRGPHR